MKKTDKLIEESQKARQEVRESVDSLSKTIDRATELFAKIKASDKAARFNPEDLRRAP